MTTILRLFSKMFGYDYHVVKAQPTASRQKIVTMGFLILIPVVLWTFSGFYLAHILMGIDLIGSLIVALFLGGLILAIDRSFVATPKGSRTTLLIVIRGGFALISTILGSLAIDLALFQGDLVEYRSQTQATERQEAILEYKEKHGVELRRLERKMTAMDSVEASLGYLHVLEMTGKGGSGVAGKGKISDKIELKQQQKARELAELKSELAKKSQSLDSAASAYAEEKVKKRQDALISQLKDLHAFVFQDSTSKWIYWIFFGFVFLLEVFFILYKSSTGDTSFDEYIQAEEDHQKQELESYKRRKARVIQDREIIGDDYQKVIKLLGPGSKMRVM
ncbi:DUF4407 domain-containing protein [Algoriphagus kandeliae]|uniref:DUF4407 domain-containing protein n=1 Tax=Algoriphagus kandeliae TaxID=2562278 RepID=A0A4Y9QPD1_9BACT|nr:DUF4407 domain-containing protein [Algoriphagus kandeliae]TFV94484.1 DUF4407 domain-containing protein [Algoriphagus kandeliae]